MNFFETQVAALVLAPIVGSFLGVVVRRLPAGRSIVVARSACGTCLHRLGPRDLVPLVSYAMSSGRCRHCGAAIGWFHPAIEGAALLVALIAVAVAADSSSVWFGCALGWTLLALAWIDWEHQRLPDALTLPLLLGGLGATGLLSPADLTDHAAAALVGYAAFRGLAVVYRRLRGREGMGQGDAKLLAAGGAWVGLAALPPVVLAGALVSLAAIAWRKGVTRFSAVPFGPGLAVAIWVVWVLKEAVLF